MQSRTFAVGLLALACVTAAAGGAYVAVRQNHSPAVSGPIATEPSQQPVGAAQAASPAVQETEALVAPPTPPSEAPIEEKDRAEPAPTSGYSEAAPRTVRTNRTQPVSRRAARETPVAHRDNAPSRASRSSAVGTPTPSPVDPEVPISRTAIPVDLEPLPVELPRPEPPAPPTRIFDELIVPASSVIGLQIETPVSSERGRVEDRVEARVLRDVAVDGRAAIPAGARAIGAVTLVERGGKMKERARLGVRFHTLVLADGTELPMRTEAILREGDSPVGESARKIGGAAVGGAILGAIMGGKKGAIIGAATGAAGGSAVVMTGDRNAATLPVGAVVTVRLSAPLPVEVERR